MSPHIPKPHQRPSVSLSSNAPKKAWVNVPTSTLAVGDIVTTYGEVAEVEHRADVRVTFINGRVIEASQIPAVLAFVRVP